MTTSSINNLLDWITLSKNFCIDCGDECDCGDTCACTHDCICPDINLPRGSEILFTVEEIEALCKSSDLELFKAIVSTPTNKEGRFEGSEVESGDSVWITVGNPESPLHGRPVLITRRPDGLFAITGGAGKDAQSRRHVVLTGSPKKTRRDKELESTAREAEAFNEPLIAARKELDQQSRKEIKEASGAMLEAMGIKETDKKDLLDKKDDVQNHVADILGENNSEAKRITDTIMSQIVRSEREIKQRSSNNRQASIVKIGKRLKKFKEDSPTPPSNEEVSDFIGDAIKDEIEEFPEINAGTVSIPDIEQLKDLTPNQQESVIANHFANAVNNALDENSIEHTTDEDTPSVELGETVEPLELKSEEDLNKAIDSIKSYWNTREQSKEKKEALRKVPATQISPTTLADLTSEIEAADMSLDQVEELAEQDMQRWQSTNSALALYSAISDKWNDDTSIVEQLTEDTTAKGTNRFEQMKYHIDAGAATALSALAKEHLGTTLDTSKLIEKVGIEAASAFVAMEIRNKYRTDDDTAGYKTVLEKLQDHNTKNQIETERLALERHTKLAEQSDEINRQIESGELVDQARIDTLSLDNLLEQRKNLGAALGSLQASGTLYDLMAKYENKKDDVIHINVGDNYHEAQSVLDRLDVNKGKYTRAEIDQSDPDNYKVSVGLGALSKHVKQEKDTQERNDKYESFKTSMDGVVEDARGNLIVDKYDVPGWNDTFEGDDGERIPYKWRVEQRNDIEWLRSSTETSQDNPTGQGGGLVTRVTGAGKTNTALGFFAHKISENPDYRGICVVPKGRSGQWHEELEKFSNLNSVLIPDNTTKEEVDRILANVDKGTVVMIGHREASRSHETLQALQTDETLDGKFDGIVIDEPQELQSKGGSGKIGAQGKRLMNVPVNHRIGLTATPARRVPTEAYDLIKWTQGSTKELGPRTQFDRTFKGFGSGVNAQDTAISDLYFKTIRPYISGDRITDPEFKVNHSETVVSRSDAQKSRQAEIEANSAERIRRETDDLITEADANPNHALNRGAERNRRSRARNQVRRNIEKDHTENTYGGDYSTNPKIQAVGDAIKSDPDTKHVIYIDSQSQRKAIGDMLKNAGYSANQIKNIASTTGYISGADMTSRVKAFKEDKNIGVMLIDANSASGYNLQVADTLHVLGSPSDAATYLQAQGRVARSPRVGDVNIKTYKYNDVPSEQADWNELDAQLKMLKAAAPGLFPD